MVDSLIVSLMLLGAASSSGELPFWSVANTAGTMPQYNGAMSAIDAYAGSGISDGLTWDAGLSLSGVVMPSMFALDSPVSPVQASVDQLFAGLKWRSLSLDAGIRIRPQLFPAAEGLAGSISSTGGNVAWSGNSRQLPGITLTLDPVAVPFTSGHLLLFGRYGDYLTTDRRYVQGALLHNMQVGLTLRFGRFDFTVSLDHYALWGGLSPDFGRMPVTLGNYFRVATGRSASPESNSTDSDKINVLGDHGGAECFRFGWRGEGWRLTFQHDIPYNDGSGMGFANWPDGVNTLHLGFDRSDMWVTSLLYEFAYTMWQSGTRHEGKDPATGVYKILGGLDNYFNNQDYRSGWTFAGMTAGFPLMFPCGTREGSWRKGGLTLGVENNRLVAHHFGISGKLFRQAPYRLMVTMSRNYGTYKAPYLGQSQIYQDWGKVEETPLRQFSACFNGVIPGLFGRGGLSLLYGIYYDSGELLREGFGLLLGIGMKIY